GVTQELLSEDPYSGHVFCFCNRRRDRLKLLLWDRSGFWVFAKRLEQGTFAWPDGNVDSPSLLITMKELMCVLEGIDLRDARMRKRMRRSPA
ncbi:MAG: IS66 family insertion sequence element accessory protein TnpB, partial [bacterium]|nr:IS66 family insertion sequence element accessory protein TnpB [bacterium]